MIVSLVASVSMGWRGSYRKVYKAVDCEVRARLAPKDGLQDTINQEVNRAIRKELA